MVCLIFWSTKLLGFDCMEVAVAYICVLVLAVCMFLMVFKPAWVFYIFLVSVVYSHILYGYIEAANNLGLPRIWTPADVLVWMVLVATCFVPKTPGHHREFIGTCLKVLAIASGFALFVGLLRNYTFALTYSRVAHVAAAILFGLRYFTSYSRVNRLLRFIVILLISMFVIHVCIRYAILTPPIAVTEYTTELGGERGGRSLVPMLYLVLVSIAVGRLVCKVGFSLFSMVLLLIGIAGIVLGETRSTYGAISVLVSASVLLFRGRMKNIVIYGLVGLVLFFIAGKVGYDFLSRFHTKLGKEAFAISSAFEAHTWRGMEYRTIIGCYSNEPYFLLTGRGVGALHFVAAKQTFPGGNYVGYYHSEYIGWLDRCGLIGLITVIIIVFASLKSGFFLSRQSVLYMRLYGVTCFLVIVSVMAEGLFHPILSHERGASVVVCFFVILANRRIISEGLTASCEEVADISDSQLDYEEVQF